MQITYTVCLICTTSVSVCVLLVYLTYILYVVHVKTKKCNHLCFPSLWSHMLERYSFFIFVNWLYTLCQIITVYSKQVIHRKELEQTIHYLTMLHTIHTKSNFIVHDLESTLDNIANKAIAILINSSGKNRELCPICQSILPVFECLVNINVWTQACPL